MKPFVFRKVVQAIGLLLLAFLLLRVVGPWLIDMHNTPALILAGALLIGGAVLVAWFAWDLITSIRRRGDRHA
jgi:hypothetical protein